MPKKYGASEKLITLVKSQVAKGKAAKKERCDGGIDSGREILQKCSNYHTTAAHSENPAKVQHFLH
ncbi:hypothetical protein [Paenibacillus dendritiformis]|uniref:hypothetical protein n=1 Tax=Paenibacillus dendritiformis TaxID=130049 RepID=UPI0015EBC588|nr:hypothetical protein [Paenibacillus dendritiformis]